MARDYVVFMDSKGALLDLANLPEGTETAARIAINRATAKARTLSAKYARSQVNFPAHYVSASEGRLHVSKKATNGDLEGIVSARTRPTSLARFATGSIKTGKGQQGATVQVKPGVARYMRNAFFVKLRRGGESTDTNHNLGLAIRTKGGVKPDAAYKPIKMRNGMWLLYGPSVSQALLSARDTGIWPNITDEIMDNLHDEFFRQLEL